MARQQTGSIVTRDGKLYARVRFTTPNGQKRDIWRKADSRAHAQKLIRQMLTEIQGGAASTLEAASLTFAQLADYYIKNYLHEAVYNGERKISGVRGVSEALSAVRPLIDYFGKRPIRLINYGEIRSYKLQRLQTPTIHGKQRGIAPVNRELSKLRRIFNIAMQQGWLVKSPFHGGDTLISLADEKHRERILSRDEEMRLLAVIDAEPKRAHLRGITLVALDCGLRCGEILTLRWSDINLATRTITVRAFNAKTARKRVVAMTGRLYQELNRLWQLEHRSDDLVFGVKVTIKTAWGKTLKAAGITDLKFHDLRHTAITRMIRAGMPPVEVMRVSGHSTMSAFYRYANLDSDAVFRVAAALDTYLAENAPTEPPRPVESAVMVEATGSVN